jgi:hypothetical protein
MSMELRVVQYFRTTPEGDTEYTRYVLQYRDTEWEWSPVPEVFLEEGNDPPQD